MIEDATEENKDSFYGQLQAATEEVRTDDILMIIGDLNDRERVMGKHGFGTINDNRE